MLSYQALKVNSRNFLAATSMTVEEFERLLSVYPEAYTKCYPADLTLTGQPRQRQPGGGSKGVLEQDEDRLLFILIYTKTNPLQSMHGLMFGLSQAQANYWIHHLLPVIQEALRLLEMLPEREGSQVATSALALESKPDLAIDGTERRRQRPQDATAQKEHYSGKKKAHTDKNIIVANEETGKVAYLGPTENGAKHDKKAADDAAIAYPPNATLDKDTGFQGYEPEDVLTRQPQKKPRNRELSVIEKFFNRLIAKTRIIVENVLAGVKRCRIVKDMLRLTTPGVSDLVMEIACGLHNLRVSCRHPLPAFDIFQLHPT